MRVGDVLLLPDHHVALYREQVDLDGASIGIRVTEAASRCGAGTRCPVCPSVGSGQPPGDWTSILKIDSPLPGRRSVGAGWSSACPGSAQPKSVRNNTGRAMTGFSV
jgi:hypothetical protein